MRFILLPLSCLSCLLFAVPARADEVVLKDGRVLSGKVVEKGKRVTLLDRDRKYAFARSKIVSIKRKRSFMDEYEDRLARLPEDDAEAIFEFGRWLGENEWESRARRAYEEVLDLDADHRGARRELGYKLYEGEWVSPDELNRRKGLVEFDGRWYTRHDLEQLKRRIQGDEKLRQAIQQRRQVNSKLNRMVKKFATYDKKKRRQAYDELYRYAEQLNSPEIRKFADDTKAYFDEQVRINCAKIMARTEIRATHTRLKRPIDTFETNLGAAIAITAAQNPVKIQLPELSVAQVQTTVDIPAGCK